MSDIGEGYFENIEECPKCKCKKLTAVVKTEEKYHKEKNGVSRDEFPNFPIGVKVFCDNCDELIEEWVN